MQLDLTRFRQPVSHVSRRFQPAEFGEGEGEGDAYRVVSPVDLEFDLHKDKKYDLKLEREAISQYNLRCMQAEECGEIGLKLKLEEIILEETGHAEMIERILKGM